MAERGRLRQALVVVALGVTGAYVTHAYVTPSKYYPTVVVAAPEGLIYIAVQDATSERQACGKANERFLAPIKAGCKDCKVVSARCERVLEGDFTKVLQDTHTGGYRIVAPGLRMLIEGPEGSARRECDLIARDIANRGVHGAACIPP